MANRAGTRAGLPRVTAASVCDSDWSSYALRATPKVAPTLLQVRLKPDTTRSDPPEGGHYMDALLLTAVGAVARCPGSRRPKEQPLSVGQDHVCAIGAIGTILRAVPLDGDLRAGLQRFLGEATPHQRVRRAAFDHPPGDGAIGILHIEVNPRVRIDPIHLDDGALERHRLIGVELGGEGVMRGK